MLVKPWARQHGVAPSTVFSAIQLGRIARAADGGLDDVDALAWLRSRRDRIDHDRAAESRRDTERQRALDAMAAQASIEIVKLRRQIGELRRATVPADVVHAARDRRWGRLKAALAAMPALHAVAVADAVGRPPAAVARVLTKLVVRVVRDLGTLADR